MLAFSIFKNILWYKIQNRIDYIRLCSPFFSKKRFFWNDGYTGEDNGVIVADGLVEKPWGCVKGLNVGVFGTPAGMLYLSCISFCWNSSFAIAFSLLSGMLQSIS